MRMPKGFLYLVLITVPVWICAGLLWSILVRYFEGWDGGSIPLLTGIGWGVYMWALFDIAILFLMVEKTITLKIRDKMAFRAKLDKKMNDLRYQLSPRDDDDEEIIYWPRKAIKWRFNQVRVRLGDEKVVVAGPWVVVRKLEHL